jgi:hypothetical protein
LAVVVSVLLAAAGLGCSSGATRSGEPTGTVDAAEATGPAGSDVGSSRALLAAVCDGTATVTDAGTLTSSATTELSGIAASRANPGVWWVHNDSGDSARVFAISDTGSVLATVELDGAPAPDWEDIAVGPSDDGVAGSATVYVGDIGDNGRSRSSIAVYRFAEPEVDATTPDATIDVPADRLTLTYPDGPHDAEALLVDPGTGDLVIVTKDWTLRGHSNVYRAPAGLAAGSSTVLELVAELELPVGTLVTAADVSPDASVVALRSYGGIALYPRPAGQPVWAAFDETPCDGPRPMELQGEAIAFSADGASYATIAEGASPTLHLTR